MFKFGLRASLMSLVAASVAVTALLVHLSWDFTARQNVGDVVKQLNRHIVDTVYREFFSTNYNIAWSTQEAIRMMVSSGGITEQGGRTCQSVMLSLLRSQPSLSWVAIAMPNGDVFGYHRADNHEIDWVEVRWSGAAKARFDTKAYDLDDDRLTYKSSTTVASSYKSIDQAWYQEAVKGGDMVPSLHGMLPGSDQKTLFFSAPILDGERTTAVVTIAIDLERLSLFLQGLQVGRSGTVVILSRDGGVVASAEGEIIPTPAQHMFPSLAEMSVNSTLLTALKRQLDSGQPNLKLMTDPHEYHLDSSDPNNGYFINFSPLSFQGWTIATIIPDRDFLSMISANSRLLLEVLVGLTVILVLSAVILGDRLIGAPLLRITEQFKFIEHFDLGSVQRLKSPLRELDNLSAALMQMSFGLASFQKYMPITLVKTLLSQGIEAQPGGHQQELTVLFTDIAGFTSLSEQLGDDIVPVLTSYLNLASRAILDAHGTIDKFIGDAVMAFWGAPVVNPNHAADACRAALDFQRKLAASRHNADGPQLFARVGLNSGRMLVGNVGSNDRLNYTVIGDPVNIASRLEALNKSYGTEILIGENTRQSAGSSILVRRLDVVAVYGRTGGIAVYELLGMAGDFPPPPWIGAYESGLEAYADRQWDKAIAQFTLAAALRGGDPPSQFFIQRCRSLLAQPPGPDWSYVTKPESK